MIAIMMEENNDIFLAEGDAQKIFHNICLGPYIQEVRILGLIFQPPSTLKAMYTFRVTVSAVGLFQKILLSIIAHMY